MPYDEDTESHRMAKNLMRIGAEAAHKKRQREGHGSGDMKHEDNGEKLAKTHESIQHFTALMEAHHKDDKEAAREHAQKLASLHHGHDIVKKDSKDAYEDELKFTK